MPEQTERACCRLKPGDTITVRHRRSHASSLLDGQERRVLSHVLSDETDPVAGMHVIGLDGAKPSVIWGDEWTGFEDAEGAGFEDVVPLRPLILEPLADVEGRPLRLLIEMFLYEQEHGFWPTYRELARRSGFGSESEVHRHSRALLTRGLLLSWAEATIDSKYGLARALRPDRRKLAFARIDGQPCLYEVRLGHGAGASGAESERAAALSQEGAGD